MDCSREGRGGCVDGAARPAHHAPPAALRPAAAVRPAAPAPAHVLTPPHPTILHPPAPNTQGAAALITNPDTLTAAAGILAVEGYHGGVVRYHLLKAQEKVRRVAVQGVQDWSGRAGLGCPS